MYFFQFLLILLIVLSVYCLFLRNSFYLLFNLLLIFTLWAILFFYFSDFLSLLIILVYTGGIAVLFLFTSFVLDLNFFLNISHDKNIFFNLVLFFLLGIKFIFLGISNIKSNYSFINTLDLNFFSYKIQIFSKLLYQDYPTLLIFVALVLLIAMIGSIASFRQKKLN